MDRGLHRIAEDEIDVRRVNRISEPIEAVKARQDHVFNLLQSSALCREEARDKELRLWGWPKDFLPPSRSDGEFVEDSRRELTRERLAGGTNRFSDPDLCGCTSVLREHCPVLALAMRISPRSRSPLLPHR